MDTLYYLVVSIQTPKGMIEIGKFLLGPDQVFASDTFKKMEGDKDLHKYPFIRLDLISQESGLLPVCHESIGCNLDQYSNNSKILTKEVFKHFMFEGSLIYKMPG